MIFNIGQQSYYIREWKDEKIIKYLYSIKNGHEAQT